MWYQKIWICFTGFILVIGAIMWFLNYFAIKRFAGYWLALNALPHGTDTSQIISSIYSRISAESAYVYTLTAIAMLAIVLAAGAIALMQSKDIAKSRDAQLTFDILKDFTGDRRTMRLRRMMYTHMDQINKYLKSDRGKNLDRDRLSEEIKKVSSNKLSIDDLAYLADQMDHVSFMIRQGYVSSEADHIFYYGILKNWRFLRRYVQFERDWRKNEGGNWWCCNYIYMVNKMLSGEYKTKLKRVGTEPLKDEYVNSLVLDIAETEMTDLPSGSNGTLL